MSVGENIRKIRKQQGLSMAELGERIGITAAALSRYELGQRKIGIGTLRRIAQALNVNPFELYPEDERANAIVAHLRWKLRDDSFSADELSDALSEMPEEYRGDADGNVIVQGNGKPLLKVPITPKDRIESAFERLSPEGQQAAAERLEELALLEKYQKKEPSDGS